MFTEKELKHIYECVTDSNLKSKIESMLFINEKLVERIKSDYINHNLIKIIKIDCKNSYKIYILDNDDNDDLPFPTELNSDIESDFDKFNNLDIHTVCFDNINKTWYHSGTTVFENPKHFKND